MGINKNFIVGAGIEVATTANVVSSLNVGGNTTISGNLSVSGITSFSGNVVVSGNLTVTGTTTYVNTATLNVSDNIITLNSDVSGSPSENSGIEVNRGTSSNVSFIWNETSDKWTLTENGTTYWNVHHKGVDIILGTDTSGNYVSTISSLNTALTVSGSGSETSDVQLSLRSANTTTTGITQLVDSTSNTSITHAATANSVKTVYDIATVKVTSVATGNGLTGGTITTTGTISAVGSAGIVSNTTGLFVNTAYIATLSANNASYLGGIAASGYQTTAGLSSNVATLSSNNSSYLGGILADNYFNYVQTLGDAVDLDTITASGWYHQNQNAFASSGSNYPEPYAGLLEVYAKSSMVYQRYTLYNTGKVYVRNSYNSVWNPWSIVWSSSSDGSGSTLDADLLDGQQGTYYSSLSTSAYNNAVSYSANASNLSSGTVPSARLPAANATSSGGVILLNSVSNTSVATYAAAPAAVKTAYDAAIAANTLAASKGTVSSIATGSGLTGGTITTTGTISVVAGSGIISNTSGVFVNASSISIGTIPTGILGSGTANSSTYLRGDNTWQLGHTESLAPNGWVKLPNGVIIQWGTATAASEVFTTIYYPTAYTTISRAVVSGSYGYTSPGADQNLAEVYDSYATFFRVYSAANGPTTIQWISVGY